VGTFGICAVASWPKEEWGYDPVGFAEMRPGCYDVHERIRDMDVNGVLASMCFPTMAGFSGRGFFEAADPSLGLIMLQAYNDWHIDEWCAAYPGRFIPLAILPLWDMDAAIAEVGRVAAKGCHAVSVPEAPHALGLPSFHTGAWDRLFAALVEHDVVLCLHIGVSGRLVQMAPEAPNDVVTVLSTQLSIMASNDLLWGPTLRRHPGLRVAFSEGGIGWIPYYLERCDRHYLNRARAMGQDFGGRLPSEVFREHVLACFITDVTGLKNRHDIGVDLIAWECDFPHSDANWPRSPELLMDEFHAAGCTDDEITAITYGNTARFFSYDPFAHVARADATVGALRARAGDVDTSTTSRREWREKFRGLPGVEPPFDRDVAPRDPSAHPNAVSA
jgi:predicted TIM-barrel fold metal-dependent hydrolase